MSVTVDSSTSVVVAQSALQQKAGERKEKVENDNDGDDKRSSLPAQQTQNGPVAGNVQEASGSQQGGKGQHVNTYA